MPPAGSGPGSDGRGQSKWDQLGPEAGIAQSSPKAEVRYMSQRRVRLSVLRTRIASNWQAESTTWWRQVHIPITEVSNDAVEVELQGLSFHPTLCIRLLHNDRGRILSGGQDFFNHLEKDGMTDSLPRFPLAHGAWKLKLRNMSGVL